MRRTWSTLALAAAVVLGITTNAHAGALDACGDIFYNANFQCRVEPPGVTCSAKCTPLAMETSCRAQVFSECKNQCTLTTTTEEVQVCQNSCVTQCNLNPGSFDCSVDCKGKCTADCSGKCAADPSSANCVASCQASCSGYCGVDCQGVLPSVSCTEKCGKSCHAELVAKVNMDCQLKCQTVTRYTDCTTRLTGGCQVQCQGKDGALFCNDQFVNFTSSLQQCIDALKNLNVSVDWHVSFSTSGCQLGGTTAGGTGLILLGLVALLILVRRRRG